MSVKQQYIDTAQRSSFLRAINEYINIDVNYRQPYKYINTSNQISLVNNANPNDDILFGILKKHLPDVYMKSIHYLYEKESEQKALSFDLVTRVFDRTSLDNNDNIITYALMTGLVEFFIFQEICSNKSSFVNYHIFDSVTKYMRESYNTTKYYSLALFIETFMIYLKDSVVQRRCSPEFACELNDKITEIMDEFIDEETIEHNFKLFKILLKGDEKRSSYFSFIADSYLYMSMLHDTEFTGKMIRKNKHVFVDCLKKFDYEHFFADLRINTIHYRTAEFSVINDDINKAYNLCKIRFGT